ncbi:discoidin domain-containing protein, partial [Clostridium tarantellae]
KNLALNKQAVSSSNETDYFTANLVTDGNNESASSRWSSGAFINDEHQWIYIDLGEITEFDTVKLYWEVANATIYRIEVSNDATNWTSVYRTTEGMGGVETITLTSIQSARYVRVYCEKNNTVISVSLYEIEIYNMIINSGINIAEGKRIYGRNANEKNSLVNAIDGDLNTYWDGGQYPSYLEIDLEKVYSLESINIVNYVDGVRYYYYSVYGSKDGVNYNKIAKKNNNNMATTEGDTFKLNSGVEARYLRVLIEYCSANEAAHISEFRVYGKETGEISNINKAINIQNFADTEYASPITIEETLNEIMGIITRRLGSQYINWFDFSIKANTNNLDYFQISNGDNGKIKIEGNNGVSL